MSIPIICICYTCKNVYDFEKWVDYDNWVNEAGDTPDVPPSPACPFFPDGAPDEVFFDPGCESTCPHFTAEEKEGDNRKFKRISFCRNI
jgi:hypothetical protein